MPGLEGRGYSSVGVVSASGAHVIRSDESPLARQVYFDAGPTGVGSHAHHDLLSLTYDGFGQPLLIDPGAVPQAYAVPDVGRYSRRTFVHNTLTLAPDDEAMTGSYPSHEGDTELAAVFQADRLIGEDFVQVGAWYDASFSNGTAGRVYRGVWMLTQSQAGDEDSDAVGAMLVFDCVLPTTEATATIRFNVPVARSDVRVSPPEAPGAVTARVDLNADFGEAGVWVEPLLLAGQTIGLEDRATVGPVDEGTFAITPGALPPPRAATAVTVTQQAAADSPAVFATLITSSDEADRPPVTARWEAPVDMDDGRYGVVVTAGGREFELAFRPPA